MKSKQSNVYWIEIIKKHLIQIHKYLNLFVIYLHMYVSIMLYSIIHFILFLFAQCYDARILQITEQKQVKI